MLINLTPHDIAIYSVNRDIIAQIPRTGQVARVKTVATENGEFEINRHLVPVVSNRFGEVEDLPDPRKGVMYIVSLPVVQAVKNRPDVIAPDTGPESAVRNGKGEIIGVRRFTR